MMSPVCIVSDNIISPLGYTTAENFQNLSIGKSGIEQCHKPLHSGQLFYASLFNDQQNDFINQSVNTSAEFTRFEKLLILSITNALNNCDIDIEDAKTALIISSTKGSISLLETEPNTPALQQRIALHTSAKKVAGYFKHTNNPIVVSNACISGLTALLIAKRLIQSGQYAHAIVAGADVISKFILSGFQSFQAVSDRPCKPFDAARNGITLGEAAGTVVLSSGKNCSSGSVVLSAGAVSNDANHISGPSRTGEELNIAINKALHAAGLTPNNIDFISAHGTATIFNDEMEAKAFSLAGLNTVPLNSLKGNYGHTLGAAGLIESIISVEALKQNTVLPTLGFQTLGVSSTVNVCSTVERRTTVNCLKTASGFGGCNAALIFCKQ